MRLLLLCLSLCAFGTVRAADPIPPCACGCATTGQCKCKSCNEHTADPAWKGKAASLSDPYAVTYASLRAFVESGHTGYLAVGVPDPWVSTYLTHCAVPSGFGGLKDGVYQCFMFNGTPSLVPVSTAQPATFNFTIPGSSCPNGRCPNQR